MLKSKFRKAALGLAIALSLGGGAALAATPAAASAPTHVVIQTAHPNDWWL